ncbi:MAG: hypothetical protein JWM82_2706, partial [Myxococcales bacterium]|nr:hypothetical protein [Myxococcales bacterium]
MGSALRAAPERGAAGLGRWSVLG